MTRFRREDMHFDKWQERTYALNGKLSANSKFENAVADLKLTIVKLAGQMVGKRDAQFAMVGQPLFA